MVFMREDKMVVLAFITKDSHTKMKRAPVSLVEVLNSTLQIPYHYVILVDDSQDETSKIFEEWCLENGKKLQVAKGAGTRAMARQKAIDLFLEGYSDEWFMFVDDDVILTSGWWKEAEPHTSENKVGLIWGVNWDGYPERPRWLKALGIDYREYLVGEFFRRGGTHDIMLRREAIKGIQIPSELHVFEDWYILRHVQKQDFEVRILDTGVIHYNPWSDLSHETLRLMGYLACKYGVEDTRLWYRLYRLVRSVAGLPLNLYQSVKGFGFKEGIPRGWRRWRDKVLYRIYMLAAKPMKEK